MFGHCSPSVTLLGLFFLFSLSLFVLHVALLDLAANLGHLNVVHVVVVLLHVTVGAVSCLTIAFVLAALSSRFHADVLGGVGLFIELMSEVLGHDVTAVLIIFLKKNLLQLLTNGIHDLCESESHRLVGELTNVLVELLINFLRDTGRPGGNLVICKLDFLVDLLGLLVKFKILFVLLVKLSQLGSKLGLSLGVSLVLILVLVVVHLEFLQLLTPVLVVLPKFVDFGFVFAYRLEKLGVGLFACQEQVHDFLHVGVSSGGSNLLECAFDFKSPIHLPFHLGLHEGAPQTLS